MKLISGLVTLYAVLLLLVGVALLFAPEAFGAAEGPAGSGSFLFAQLLGAALLGFGAANGVARRSPLGGIYGRAVVAGNQAFAFVGTLLLLGNVPEAPGLGFWLLLFVLGYGAVLHSTLLFRGPRLGPPPDPPLDRP